MTPPSPDRPTTRRKSTAYGKRADRAADLTADLLVDLTAPRALPSAPPPAATSSGPMPGGTPALSLTLTPLRWRLPALAAPGHGVGVAVRVGPLHVEVAF